MGVYPIALHGEKIKALVVGGGSVAARKVASLLEAGAKVKVIAPQISRSLEELAQQNKIRVELRAYQSADMAHANIVIAATDHREVNATVARDAEKVGVMVNVADKYEEGDFSTMAVHRVGKVTVAINAGRSPKTAVRVRDEIAQGLKQKSSSWR